MALTINVIAGGGVRHCVTCSCKTQNPPHDLVPTPFCEGPLVFVDRITRMGESVTAILIFGSCPRLSVDFSHRKSCPRVSSVYKTVLLSSFCTNFWPSKQSSGICLSPNAIVYFMKQQTSCYFIQYILLLVDQCLLILKNTNTVLKPSDVLSPSLSIFIGKYNLHDLIDSLCSYSLVVEARKKQVDTCKYVITNYEGSNFKAKTAQYNREQQGWDLLKKGFSEDQFLPPPVAVQQLHMKSDTICCSIYQSSVESPVFLNYYYLVTMSFILKHFIEFIEVTYYLIKE